MPQYSKTTWVDGTAPAISAANLNKLEQGVFDSIRQDGSTTMSAQLVTIAGSAATPAIAPTGDSNTGIFFPAADTIAFGEGGLEVMRITPEGKIAINNTAVNGNYILNVSGASGASGTFGGLQIANLTGGSTVGTSIKLGYIADFYGARITAYGNNSTAYPADLAFEYGNGSTYLESMRITSAGNVGIGTTTTNHKLEVAGDVSIWGSNASRDILINSDSNYGILQSYNNKPLKINADGNNVLLCSSSGNVGIGTTSPSNYAGRATVSINGADGGALELKVSDTTKFQIYPESSAITDSIVLNAAGANGYMRFQIYNSEQMRLNNNGYLLIGYTSSNGAYPLQVNGQIFATSSTIATSDGKYKKDIVALDGALDIVKALNPVQFSWKEHPVHKFNTDVPTVGFIAQEVEQALADKSYLTSIIKKSECTWETETGETIEREVTRDVEKQVEREITEEIDGEEITRTVTETVIEQVTEIVTEPVKETHIEEFLGIAESNMIAILTKALQELTAKVEALEAQLAK